ncbi:decaprenyl-phosphate phosphoribosyltransferase [Ilumatobacter sp.]|uniref:decaprenyl-phosphate phosphoribosyltransferase n=1 Tax=Ilumatobacter sp. TaxID=1967498 RepID=UPI003C5883F1
MIGSLVRAMRPKQWLKNVLVFAAPGAAGVLDTPSDLVATLIVFVAFCLAASGIYIWNDLSDIEADRTHPTKRNRPIAAGLIPVNTARVIGVILPVAALAVAAATGRWQTVVIVGVYIVLTLCYTFWLKEVAIIDLLAIAAGFVLRAAGGAVAVDVPMSRWFVLCVTFGSLFIVVGKRYAELQELGIGAGTRATLDTYTPGFLRMLLSVSLGGALISYCVWAFETAEGTDIPFYELSIVPMIAALFRYLLVLERGEGSAPEEVFASDRVLQLAGLAWIIIYGIAVYTA